MCVTIDENRVTKKTKNDEEPSKRFQFRLKLTEALFVEELMKNAGNQTVTQFFRELIRSRGVYEATKREQANLIIKGLSEKKITPKDLIDAGLNWEKWTEK